MRDGRRTPGTGRRSAAGRALSPTGLLAVLLPLLTVGALALVRPDPPTTAVQPAEAVPVRQADLVCPAATGRGSVVATGPAGELDEGSAGVDRGGRGRATTDVRLRSDAVTTIEGRAGALFVRASGDLAAQLLAARFQPRGSAAVQCPLPRTTYWFTGVGADADPASVLELANPDSGPAVADVTVLGRQGVLDVPELRGLTVPGGRSVEVDLARAVPTTSELALRVVVSRGRLGAAVRDEVPALGTRTATRDWLPAATGPAAEQLLVGLAPGRGRDTLTLANPGDDEARVEVRVVTTDAAFVPEGLEEVAVAPGSVESVRLTSRLRDQIRDGALGVMVSSTAPVTAGLASVVEGDLSHAPVVAREDSAMTALVPPGDSSVVLAASEGTGVAVVAAYDDGRLLGEERVELAVGAGGRVELPARTSLVRVTPRRTAVAAAVVTTGAGATIVPLGDLVRTALVPGVRPGLLQRVDEGQSSRP